jgi:hypothetical protein
MPNYLIILHNNDRRIKRDVLAWFSAANGMLTVAVLEKKLQEVFKRDLWSIQNEVEIKKLELFKGIAFIFEIKNDMVFYQQSNP